MGGQHVYNRYQRLLYFVYPGSVTTVVESKSLNGVTHGDIDNDINITGLYQTRQGGTTCIN